MGRNNRLPPWFPLIFIAGVLCLFLLLHIELNGSFRTILTSGHEQQKDEPTSRVLRVSPSDLLSVDERKRLEPRIDFIPTGCISLEACEAAQTIGFETEIREQEISQPKRRSYSPEKMPDAASFSIRKLTNTKKFRYVQQMFTKGSSENMVTEEDVPECYRKSNFYTRRLTEPRELHEGEKAVVCAFVIPEEGVDRARIDFAAIEDLVKESQWALVVRVWWESKRSNP